MSTSFPDALSTVVKKIRRLEPRSVLDIGCGFGKYGVLCREYLDVWYCRERREQWRARIDAVEAFPGVLTPLHRYVYDHMYHGDIRELADGLGGYDLALLMDVIEHLPKEDGLRVLQKLREKCSSVLLSTPARELATDSGLGNPYQVHLSFWTLEDLGRDAEVLETYPLLVACIGGQGTGDRGGGSATLPRTGATVAVAGGFDPLHVGHLRHMEQAAALGDRLVAIVSTDRDMVRKKGYCFMPLGERMELLRGLKWVDEVVASVDGDGTVSGTLLQLRPDIFAKGGDRTPGNMPPSEIEACRAIGCRIVYGVGGRLSSSSELVANAAKAISGGGHQ